MKAPRHRPWAGRQVRTICFPVCRAPRGRHEETCSRPGRANAQRFLAMPRNLLEVVEDDRQRPRPRWHRQVDNWVIAPSGTSSATRHRVHHTVECAPARGRRTRRHRGSHPATHMRSESKPGLAAATHAEHADQSRARFEAAREFGKCIMAADETVAFGGQALLTLRAGTHPSNSCTTRYALGPSAGGVNGARYIAGFEKFDRLGDPFSRQWPCECNRAAAGASAARASAVNSV